MIRRLRRWGRRHRLLVTSLGATSIVAVAALAVGNVLVARQRDLAEHNLAFARKVVDEMYTGVADKLEDQKEMDDYQREILEKALGFYERFALPQSRDPSMRLEAAKAGTARGRDPGPAGKNRSGRAGLWAGDRRPEWTRIRSPGRAGLSRFPRPGASRAGRRFPNRRTLDRVGTGDPGGGGALGCARARAARDREVSVEARRCSRPARRPVPETGGASRRRKRRLARPWTSRTGWRGNTPRSTPTRSRWRRSSPLSGSCKPIGSTIGLAARRRSNGPWRSGRNSLGTSPG